MPIDKKVDYNLLYYKVRFVRMNLFFFFRNGKLIEENEKYILKGSNTELTVRNIVNSDGGPYVCRATNKAGEDEKQAFLQVFGKYYSIAVKPVVSSGRSESNSTLII